MLPNHACLTAPFYTVYNRSITLGSCCIGDVKLQSSFTDYLNCCAIDLDGSIHVVSFLLIFILLFYGSKFKHWDQSLHLTELMRRLWHMHVNDFIVSLSD